MAKKRKQKSSREPMFDDLSPHTKQAVGAVVVVVLGIFFALSLLDYAGMVGGYVKFALQLLFGGGAVLAPVVCAFYVYALLRPREDERISISKVLGIALFFVAFLGALELYQEDLGGMVGMALQWPLSYLIGTAATGMVLGALVLIGMFITFNTGIKFPSFRSGAQTELEEENEPEMTNTTDTDEENEEEPEEAETDTEEATAEDVKPKRGLSDRLGFGKGGTEFAVSSFQGPYDPPPLSLLLKDRGRAKGGDVKASANIIKRTLKNFGIEVEMDEVSIGPSVTRYALKPAEGVRISKIVGLQNNLELALAASPIRIEAPIPGKSLVGIEVPNSTKSMVGLASMLASPEFTDSPQPLLIALGRDITGNPHFANIARMPHALIAGTTGSGKSVTIHTLVTSLLYRNSPEQLRFIMVDPKRVELTFYNDIPHLLTPVITDAKKALLSLKWAIKEMERRYDILQAERVQNLDTYHSKVYKPAVAEFEKNGGSEEEKEELPEPLPYIVIIIDELSDLMQTYPRELEASIVRLAQMSRAVGIHLILATQRPEVKVITGLIKANVPTRIALKVASQIDSRTILDGVGAEKLLGYGDMLFQSGDIAKPIRLQSAFLSGDELKKVVDYLKNQSDSQELDAISFDGDGSDSSPDAFFGAAVGGEDEDDDLYEEARQTVIDTGRASTSFLQRKLRVGYSRAARLIDMLEERGVIGPQDGSKPRAILARNDNADTDEE